MLMAFQALDLLDVGDVVGGEIDTTHAHVEFALIS